MSSCLSTPNTCGDQDSSAGFAEYHAKINEALQQFRDNAFTINADERISVPLTQLFTDSDVWVERWPYLVRLLLNQSSSSPPRQSEPFQSWGRPRHLERRRQAVVVWLDLLLFLVFHWRNYGADRHFKEMGLFMPNRLKDLVDSMHLYSHLPHSTPKAMKGVIEEFLLAAIMDAKPTPTTNPLLWWVNVLQNQASLPIPGLEGHMGFPSKLEALDHYSRVLILGYAFRSWQNTLALLSHNREWIEEVVRALNEVSLDWVDLDQGPPSIVIGSYKQLLDSPAWSLLITHICGIFDRWLTDGTSGPMHVIINLSRKLARPIHGRLCYRVMMHITVEFTIDPVGGSCYPAVETTETLEQANVAARTALEKDFGPASGADQYDEVYEEDGTVRIRAFYDAANTKAIVWVEIDLVDGSTGESDGVFIANLLGGN